MRAAENANLYHKSSVDSANFLASFGAISPEWRALRCHGVSSKSLTYIICWREMAGKAMGIAAQRRRFGGLLMLLPTQLQLILVLALPSLYVLWLSFTESSYGATPEFV